MSNNSKEQGLHKSVINWYPGHMAKARRKILEKYSMIDIVYEVIDARIPYSSKIKDIYSIIGNKPKIIIMTKKDLCDLKATNKWVKYYENLGSPVVLVDLNQSESCNEIIKLTYEIMESKQIARNTKGLKSKEIRALVIGIPNVGKSTLINRLCKRKVANVGNNPGVTQNLNWLKTKSDILLLDTPGILWPKLDQGETALNLAAFTAIKQEIIPVDEVAIHILKKLSVYYPTILQERYGLKRVNDDNILEAYEKIGKSMGAFKNNEVDYEKVSNKILNDLKSEHIKGITFDRK